MLCRSHIGFFISSFVLLCSLLFSCLFVTDSFALSDLTYTFDFSVPEPILLCDISTPCSSYKYLVVERNFDYSQTGSSIGLTAQRSTSQQLFNYNLNFYFPYFVIDISQYSSLPNFGRLVFGSSVNGSISSGTYSLTLTDKTPTFSSSSGSLSITENGTYDVLNYAEAVVDVPPDIIQGDYHDDLVSINSSILVCGAILLVLYFFYSIYRLIIKNSGVGNL